MTEPAFLPFARPDIGEAEIDAVTRPIAPCPRATHGPPTLSAPLRDSAARHSAT